VIALDVRTYNQLGDFVDVASMLCRDLKEVAGVHITDEMDAVQETAVNDLIFRQFNVMSKGQRLQ